MLDPVRQDVIATAQRLNAPSVTFKAVIEAAFPTSIFDAMARGDVLQIVIFCILFGIACQSVGPKRASAVTGFAEGEVGKPSEKYVGGIGTAKQGIYLGPCTPPNQSPHHYTFILIATDLDPKALPPGLTKLELFDKLAGHVKGSTGIIGLFKNPL